MIDLFQCKRVVTVFAHPDDETLAAGGVIARMTAAGTDVHVIIPSTGLFARDRAEQEELTLHRANCVRAMKHLGVDSANIIFGDFPDNQMDDVSLLSVIKWLEPHIDRIQPDLIMTHHAKCLNIDHQVCHEAVSVIARPSAEKRIPVVCGEISGSTNFRRANDFEPNIYLEISDENLDQKVAAMNSYTTEVRPDPHPRSAEVIRAQAKVRGAESGFMWAEAFMIMHAYA